MHSNDMNDSTISQNNDIYNDIIAHNICPHQNLSGCMVCGAEFSSFTPKDERLIVEAASNGILGSFYCVIVEEQTEPIKIDDLILVHFDDMTEVATVKEVGEIVSSKRQRLCLYGEPLPTMLRKINEADSIILNKNTQEEVRANEVFKVKVQKYSLNMKLVNIHYQFDRNKLYFFYTADGRIDFRELAKDLAASFRTRIELRQIGVRDEAKRIGGLGTCGREFCCSSFLSNFKKITTQLASEQNLASNFSKLSGPCGKLKCCLSFESKEIILHEDLHSHLE